MLTHLPWCYECEDQVWQSAALMSTVSMMLLDAVQMLLVCNLPPRLAAASVSITSCHCLKGCRLLRGLARSSPTFLISFREKHQKQEEQCTHVKQLPKIQNSSSHPTAPRPGRLPKLGHSVNVRIRTLHLDSKTATASGLSFDRPSDPKRIRITISTCFKNRTTIAGRSFDKPKGSCRTHPCE